MVESFYIANLFAKFNEREINDEDYPIKVFIIPIKWFEQWKKYVNYNYFFSMEANIDLFLKGTFLTFSNDESYKKNVKFDVQKMSTNGINE